MQSNRTAYIESHLNYKEFLTHVYVKQLIQAYRTVKTLAVQKFGE